MKTLVAAFFLLCIAVQPSLAQSAFPALYRVAGVATDDALNIRATPSGSADVVGSFGPHQSGIEVVGADPSGKWFQVNTEEQTGWVAARFLQLEPGGDYLLARGINCFGTEPFWSLDLVQGATASFSRMGVEPLLFRAGLLSLGEGRRDRMIIGFGQGLAVLSAQQCSDGMSDRTYALDASVVLVEDGLKLHSGCCSIQPD